MPGIRYANIGVATTIVIVAIGAFILKDAGEDAMQPLVFGAVFAGAFVYFFTERRAERRAERDQ